MDMRKARRIGNNSICHEWCSVNGIRLNTRLPAAIQHLSDHESFPSNLTPPQALHTWDQARILHHISHQLFRIPSNRIELQAMILDEFLEYVVGCKAYAVAMFLQLVPEGDERLDITSTADDLNDNIESNCPRWALLFFCRLPF